MSGVGAQTFLNTENFFREITNDTVSIVGHIKVATELKIKVHTIFFPVVFLESTVH
jgi:hypothetical protein